MQILVTGATGFIGSTLTRQLVREGAAVRILRRATSRLDLLGEVADAVEHAEGDILHPDSVLRAMQGVRQVYHAAAYVGLGYRREVPAMYRINVRGTANVVNMALEAGVERLVHTSSIAALGHPEPPDPTALIDETTPWQPSRRHTAYADSKVQAELEVHRSIAEGLDAVIVNPSLVFGPGRPGENTMRIVENVQSGVPGYPPGATNVVDVDDVAAGHRLAMARGHTGERYLLGGENLSWETIFRTLAEALGVKPPRRRLPPALLMAAGTASEGLALLTRLPLPLSRDNARNAIRIRRFSNAKAVRELGCTFRPFEETAARIAAALA